MNFKEIKIVFSLIALCCLAIIGEANGQQSKLPPLKLQEMEMPCKQLDEAIRSGNSDRVKKALDRGDDVNCLLVDVYPLPLSAQRRDLPMVRLLLSRGAKINLGYEGETALIYAIGNTDLTMVKYLLDKGADPRTNEGSDQTYSALMLAADKGNLEIVKLLTDRGADVNSHDFSGNSAMKVAKKKGHTAIVEYLKKAGAKR
jgi:ankyrin repeat protein